MHDIKHFLDGIFGVAVIANLIHWFSNETLWIYEKLPTISMILSIVSATLAIIWYTIRIIEHVKTKG